MEPLEAASGAPDVAMHGIDCFAGGGPEKNRLPTCVCMCVNVCVCRAIRQPAKMRRLSFCAFGDHMFVTRMCCVCQHGF